MAPGPLIAGVDASTQATKVVVIDPDSGTVLATGRARHTVSGTGGARETDPRQWWRALRAAMARTGRAGEIGAIAVGGQQHGLVVLDARGRPLREAMLWNDTRSAEDARRLVRLLGAEVWAARIGSRPVASFTITKWAWLRRLEPDIARATAAVRLPHDYVTELLTGRGVTDRGDASGTGWYSTADERYAADLLGAPGVDLAADLLPTVLGPRDVAGEVSGRSARELGLRDGVVVGPGTGDNAAAALGLGLGVGQAALSLGTSGTVFAVSQRRPDDASGTVAGFADADGRFLPLAATLNCTLAVDRVAGWLGLQREDVAPAGDVVVLPYFGGERTPNLPHAPATMTGIRSDTDPRQILMATYEGAAASLIDALDAVAVQCGGGDASAPLMLVGGGARGRVWRDVIARLSGRELLVPDAQELVAIGAAVQAAAVSRGEDPAAVAARWRTSAGTRIDALPRDQARLGRMNAVLRAVERAPVLSRPGA